MMVMTMMVVMMMMMMVMMCIDHAVFWSPNHALIDPPPPALTRTAHVCTRPTLACWLMPRTSLACGGPLEAFRHAIHGSGSSSPWPDGSAAPLDRV